MSTARKTRYQVTARDKKGNIATQNIRYTLKGAKMLKSKTSRKKGVKSVVIKNVK